MRIRNLLGAALALALVPRVAAADENQVKTCQADCSSASTQSGSAAQGQVTGTLDENGNCICTPSSSQKQQGSVGGTGSTMGGESSSSQGYVGETAPQTGTEEQGATSALPPSNQQNVTVIGADQEKTTKKEEKKGQMGLAVTAGAGVEGYTSSLAPKISPGPSWGVTVTAMPTTIVGLELGYAGATNGVKDPAVGDAGTRIVRNGGNVDVRVNLLPTAVAPFVFGGIGINKASVSNETAGYKDDTFGNIPLGAGLDWRIGNFKAGARFTFNYLFDRNFTPATRTGAFGFNDKQGGDIYDGQIQLGGVF